MYKNLLKKEGLFLDPQSLKSPIPKWEYHLHTKYTDAKMSVDEILLKSLSLGIERLIFTEHTEDYKSKKPNWFPSWLQELKTAQKSHLGKMEILIGLEAPVIDFNGNLDLTPEMKTHVQYLLGTVHRYPNLQGKIRDISHKQAIQMEYDSLKALLLNEKIHAIAHIGATCIKYHGEFPMELVENIIKQAAQKEIAIELNHNYHKPFKDYFEICKTHGAQIVPGSDAHVLNQIGKAYEALRDLT